MELFTAVEQGDLVKTKFLLESRSGDEKADLINSSNPSGMTVLHIGSQRGHHNLVKYLIDHGAEVSKPSNNGDTALHYACRNGHIHVVKCLIKRGADLDTGKESPLVVASREGYLEVVEYLLEAGADVNKRSKDGISPLYLASYKGHLDIVKCLVTTGAELTFSNDSGITPLYTASLNGQYDVVKYLVNAGADVNKAKPNGDTPVHAALRKNHLHIVQNLINAGADTNVSMDSSGTPLYAASHMGDISMVECLVKGGAKINMAIQNGETSLHAASCKGYNDIVKYLVNLGADVNQTSKNCDTPLHVASRNGHNDVVHFLVISGADVNKPNQDGDTPLHAASCAYNQDTVKCSRNEGANTPSRRGIIDIVDCLVKSGAVINTRNGVGDTPLHNALRQDHLGTAKCLISNGAKCDTRGKDGETPLYLASGEGYLDIVEHLVKSEADVNRARTNGDTPLNVALRKGHLDTAIYLLSNGAECNMRDEDTDTSLYLASGKGYLDIVEHLVVTSGADVNSAFHHGNTPLHAASREGHLDIVRYLIREGAKCDARNKDGATPLYLASEKGHLGIVEQLVQSGAGIKKAKTNGETPLHGASRNGHLRIVKYLVEAGAQVNIQSQDGERPLEVALRKGHHDVVIYLSEHAEDKKKSKPTDQTSFQRSPSLSVIDHDNPSTSSTSKEKPQKTKPPGEASRSGRSTSLDSGLDKYQSSIDEETRAEGRDTINLKEYHIVAKIPTGEHCVADITMQAIEKAPSDLILKEDEAIIAVGLKFSPPGLQFRTPLKITVPHSAIFTSPKKANIFLYTRANDGDTFSGVSSAADGTPRCVVRQDDLDLYIDHFAEWWIITLLRENFIGKRLICTPYVPVLRPMNVSQCIIMVLKDDVGDTTEGIPDYKAALPGTQFLVRWRYGKLGVAYHEYDEEISHKSMEEREFYYLNNHRMYFLLSDQVAFEGIVKFILSQYITKQIMFLLSPQGYDQYYQSRSTDEQTTTRDRNTINCEEYHIVAKIPAGEHRVTDNTLQVIEKAPSDLILKEDEVIIAVGLKFSPPGLQFSTPLKITVPHSAIFTSPKKANIFLYTRANDGDTFSGVSPAADGTPRCVVRQDDLDLYIDHFSEWWIITYLRETFIGKRLMCTPYVPVLRPMNVSQCIIMVLKDDVGDTTESIPDYKAALPGTQFLVRWRYGKLGVAYRVDDKEMSHKSMEEREFYYLNNHRMYFQMEPVDPDTFQVMVKFILSQDITKQIMFPLITQDKLSIGTLRLRRAKRLNYAFDLDKEDDQYHQSRSTDEQTTTEERDTINLEEYHIVAKIPAGEQGVNDITLQVIEKAPSDLILKEDEAIIAVGLKFSPPGLQFRTPLKITVPHSAIFTSPKKANIFLYTRANDGDTFSRVPPSADGTPHCIVRRDDLDLYIDHFSEWWITTYLRGTFIGKRLMCTPYVPPYVPVRRPKNPTHYIIMVIKDDVRGASDMTEGIPRYEVLPGTETQFFLKWRCGKLDVVYSVDDKEISHKSMQEREFYYLNNHKLHFQLEPVDPDTFEIKVEFKLSQYIEKEIVFTLKTQDHPLASQLVSGKQAIPTHAEHTDKEKMEEPSNEDRDHQDTVRTIWKDPGARPKTRKDRGSCIQSHPASSSISSQISSVVHSSDCEPSSASAEMLSDLQSSSFRDDGRTTSSTQNKRISSPPQAPEIIDELDSTSIELDQMKLAHVEQPPSPPSSPLPAATAGEPIGAMALEDVPNILQMVRRGRMQVPTVVPVKFSFNVDNMTINLPPVHDGNAGNRSHIPVPTVVPVKLLHELGIRLNSKSPVLQDWKGLAVELGLDEYITSLEQCENPTEELIRLAESRHKIQNLEDLAEAFQRMKRADCEELCRSNALDLDGTCPPHRRTDDDSDSF